MKYFSKQLVIVTLIITFSVQAKSTKVKPFPLEYFAQRATISDIALSPNGKKLAMLHIREQKANPVLEIYNANNLKSKPFRINAEPMEIVGYGWVSNDDIILSFRQKVRDKIDGFNRGVYEYKLAKLDLRTNKIREYKQIGARIVNLLPHKPNKVIFRVNSELKTSAKVPKRIRPSSYYELNLKTRAKKLLLKARISLSSISFDGSGNPRYGFGFDESTDEYTSYYRKVGSKKWLEIHRHHIDKFDTFRILAVDDAKPDTLLVLAHNGANTAAIWEFDTQSKSFGEKVYGRTDIDIDGVVRHSDSWNKPDKLAGIAYRTDKTHIEYFDAEEAALRKQLESLIPFSHNIRITSRAKDSLNMTVYNSGPQDSGTYYLVKKGKLTKLGSKKPKLVKEKLAKVKYIKYTARDGEIIPAFITIPHGTAPFPAIVMPHGGPFVSETINYDEWGQMLANNGYLVIQPQYRGSRGHGLEFYKSAFINGGQGGYTMQDDKDDGVKYLIKEGLADPNRVAMFGWSYGGYAALVAASRVEQLYQCVIAGAAVTDNQMQFNYYKSRIRGSSRLEQLGMWEDSLSPIKEVAKVNIPILLVHGDVDQRVPVEHAKKYLKELKKHNKIYEYLELAGADHFSNTLFFEHKIKLYSTMIDYLQNKCGPEGL
ncbi:MAG: prolyl oligopeptidase family serine peptidase [Proteobacteria bacterium]|nr:prolyl oligopeptidase family serine peptidase [Pseudomonadota bacterium]